ncbi:unnamed protein product [Heligmosomoides polygyrus]|uniref:Secreted protein n=1 Tax=Heligmosomoides polygyrus TaxID=6339 RepID=A0A183FFS3_HELPZ|nr:unnamed protein product [Heligmosomoides polygyrus]
MILIVAFVYASVALCSAVFIPPYYGDGFHYGGHFDEHGQDHGLAKKKHGSYKDSHEHHADGYYDDRYGHDDGHKAHHDASYEDRARSGEHEHYHKGGAERQKALSYENGAKSGLGVFFFNCLNFFVQTTDADGIRKFSYFAAGSGPEGEKVITSTVMIITKTTAAMTRFPLNMLVMVITMRLANMVTINTAMMTFIRRPVGRIPATNRSMVHTDITDTYFGTVMFPVL